MLVERRNATINYQQSTINSTIILLHTHSRRNCWTAASLDNTMKAIQIVLSFLFLSGSYGEDWDGCFDATQPDAKVRQNKKTQVCFTTGPGGDWGVGIEYSRYSFQPVADKYSKFTVPGCELIGFHYIFMRYQSFRPFLIPFFPRT